MRSAAQFIFLSLMLCVVLIFMSQYRDAFAQTEPAAATADPDTTESPTDTDDAPDTGDAAPLPFEDEIVEINWGEKLADGGNTMIALLVLSVTGLASFAERLLSVRARYVAPKGLAEQVVPQLLEKNYDAVREACQKRPSTLSRVIVFIVDHLENPVETISAGTSDIGGREIRDLLARSSPLAVVASLAPLLGLLGTMIGMIEAFELVSIYGDDGGASMLAGSIAKALITTAAGLMIAIPAIAAHHVIKHRINHLTNILETDTEAIISHLYLKKPAPAEPKKEAVVA